MAFAKFKEGNAVLDKPVIRHDHGFLDDGKGNIDPSKKRAATWADYRALAKWEAMLEGAEVLRPDLDDATRSYSHFLDATGTDLEVAYEDFLSDDDAGKTVLKSLIADTVAGYFVPAVMAVAAVTFFVWYVAGPVPRLRRRVWRRR